MARERDGQPVRFPYIAMFEKNMNIIKTPRGVKANGFSVSPNCMQMLASEISRSIKYIIPGGPV